MRRLYIAKRSGSWIIFILPHRSYRPWPYAHPLALRETYSEAMAYAENVVQQFRKGKNPL